MKSSEFLVGNLAKIFNWSVIFSFHFIRLFLTPVFVVAVYIFFTLFFRESKERKLALIFLLFSDGVGAYFIAPFSLLDFSGQPGFGTPNDIWVPESITFLSLYKTPHFIASLILMILIFLLMLLAFEKKQFRYSFGAGILAAIYFNFHPFYIPLIFGTLFFYLTILIFKAKKILWFEVSHFFIVNFTVTAFNLLPFLADCHERSYSPTGPAKYYLSAKFHFYFNWLWFFMATGRLGDDLFV